MENKRIAAIIVLTAGLTGRIAIVQEIVAVFSANDPTAHYAFEPVEQDRPVPIPEEDWPIRIVREIRLSDTHKISVKLEVVPKPDEQSGE